MSRLILAGDSAGGGLALALLMLVTAAARDGKLPKPIAAAAVMSSWTDLGLTGESITTQATLDPLLRREALEQAALLYLGDANHTDLRASPLYSDFLGLRPVLLHVGEDEILLDDSARYANRMEEAHGRAQLRP